MLLGCVNHNQILWMKLLPNGREKADVECATSTNVNYAGKQAETYYVVRDAALLITAARNAKLRIGRKSTRTSVSNHCFIVKTAVKKGPACCAVHDVRWLVIVMRNANGNIGKTEAISNSATSETMKVRKHLLAGHNSRPISSLVQ